ncbi:MAG TPA: hypothetical protein VF214_11180 [Edaphobacter sp.]
MRTLLLFLLAATAGSHWVRIKDSYPIHWVYLTYYGTEIGSYYKPPKPSRTETKEPPFTAQCREGKPVEFASESEAKNFVLKCPE